MPIDEQHTKFGYSKVSDESKLIEDIEAIIDKYCGKLTYAQVIGILVIFIKEKLERDL